MSTKRRPYCCDVVMSPGAVDDDMFSSTFPTRRIRQLDIWHSWLSNKNSTFHIHGLLQGCNNPSALAMELLQSCTRPSIW